MPVIEMQANATASLHEEKKTMNTVIVDPDEYPVEFISLADEEGGGYLASYPDLPGCYAFGRTRAEALEKGAEAVRVWTRANEARAIPVPQPAAHELPSGKISVRVPKATHKRISLQAALDGKRVNNFNNFVASLLEEELSLLGKEDVDEERRRSKVVRTLTEWGQRDSDAVVLSWSYDDHDKYNGEWVQRLSPSLHHELRYRAEEQGVSINALILTLLALGLGRREAATLMSKEKVA